jgi:hypothetical protein
MKFEEVVVVTVVNREDVCQFLRYPLYDLFYFAEL